MTANFCMDLFSEILLSESSDQLETLLVGVEED